MMKKLTALLILVTVTITGYSQSYTLLPADTAVCGGTTKTYYIDPMVYSSLFDYYEWFVEGGKFANGSDYYKCTNKFDPTATVTWNSTPQSGKAKLRCEIGINNTEHWREIEPQIFSVSKPDQFFQADASGNLIAFTDSSSIFLRTYTNKPWWVDSYKWKFESEDGSTDTYTTDSAYKSIPLDSFDEYGEVTVQTYNDYCEQTSSARTAPLFRKLHTPTWDSNGYDEVMCTNSTSDFEINAVPHKEYYYWEATGGYTFWNGLFYHTNTTTSSTSVNVKAASSNGSGSISVTATSSNDGVLDSDALEIDLWTGIFPAPIVTGPGAVCPSNVYQYKAQDPPIGDGIDYTYSWTYPSNWSVYSQWANFISLYTSANPNYGALSATVTNECGTSSNAGITVYPDYDCGGYYMASPNPAGEYTEIDIASEEAKTSEVRYDSDIILTVIDKMGSPIAKINVETLPYKLDTSTLPKGEYIVQIVSQPKNRKPFVESLKLVVNH